MREIAREFWDRWPVYITVTGLLAAIVWEFWLREVSSQARTTWEIKKIHGYRHKPRT